VKRTQVSSGGKQNEDHRSQSLPGQRRTAKAYVTITIEGVFVVRDLKIIKGNEGLFVAMPSKKRKDGQFKDIAHPLNQETRNEIERAVFEAFRKEIKSMGATMDEIKQGGGSNFGGGDEGY